MRTPEADFEVSRIYWLGPLTIMASIASVLVTIAIFVFANVAASRENARRLTRLA